MSQPHRRATPRAATNLSTVRATATITLVGLLPGALGLGLGAGAVLQVRRSEGSN